MRGRTTAFVLAVGGLGGLLYGIDFGVIAVSMPYIKALGIYSDTELSWIVGAVMFGGIVASATAGVLCDRLGRKRMITVAATFFLAAIPVVCFSGTSLAVMLAGRVLQGMSAGYMAVVMPLYLTECLPPETRGRGTGIFQLFLGIGLVAAAAVGVVIAAVFGAADAATVSDAAKAVAWRVNFWWTLAPVAVLFGCSFWLKESPVWSAGRGLGKGSRSQGKKGQENLEPLTPEALAKKAKDSLLQRKYVIPFVLAVLVLTFNKTIGMSSIVAYAVTLFHKAGLTGSLGNMGDLALKSTNLVVTLVAVTLVDRKGRTWLLKVGTAGMTVGLAVIGALYLALERGWLTASTGTGLAALAAFLAMQTFYSLGPGICVWLVLSELMPQRIRANGMAIALFANQFVAWGLASSFFPLVNTYGHGPVFFAFAASAALYFITVLFIPETKGKSLAEIENLFSR